MSASGVTIMRNESDKTTTLTATLCDKDLYRVRLDSFDSMVVNSPAEQPADHLQSFEIMFRRMYEQQQRVAAFLETVANPEDK